MKNLFKDTCPHFLWNICKGLGNNTGGTIKQEHNQANIEYEKFIQKYIHEMWNNYTTNGKSNVKKTWCKCDLEQTKKG